MIKRLKRRKAPGPDEVPMEVFKELDELNLKWVQEMLNQWWNEEDIPEEMLRAIIALIYKKGDTSKMENYKPIALLNGLYKIYTAIIKKRLADGLDDKLQRTQFGFRKDKSTAGAIYLIRRTAEYGEKTNNPMMMVLLDWEKSI